MYIYAQMDSSTVSATITVKSSLDDTVVVDTVNMSKIGTGFFKFLLTDVDSSLEYYYEAVDSDNVDTKVYGVVTPRFDLHAGLSEYPDKALWKNTDAEIAGAVWRAELPLVVTPTSTLYPQGG